MKEITGPYLDVHGLCKHLGISIATVYRLLKKKNGLPGHRVGGNWRFILEEVEEWVRSKRR
jgi:excisionase family DNA binding protein